jgi:hypothetical protein
MRLAEIQAGCDIQRGDTLYRQVPVVPGTGKTQAEIDRDALLHLCGAETTVEGAIVWLQAELEGRNCSDVVIVTLLDELDDVARQWNPYELGLPLKHEEPLSRLRTVVCEWLKKHLTPSSGG